MSGTVKPASQETDASVQKGGTLSAKECLKLGTAKRRASLSDSELAALCQAGDEPAFDELVTRHQRRAVNVAYQLLRDQEDATEVAQDAFVRIYQSLDDFRGDCKFTTWLHQIVVNLARNKHRWWKRRGRHATVSIDNPVHTPQGDIPAQIASNADAPDEQTAKNEFVDTLSRKLEELPHIFREVLVLRNVSNLSYEEIAAELSCSVGTVKSRIARAREALRQAMVGEL